MAIIGVLLNPSDTGANVGALREQLRTVGAVLDPGEQTTTNYGPSTVAAVRAFRQQYGLPAGDTVDLPTGRLMHAASAFAGTGGRVALRNAVREAASAADSGQPQELYWLARYATLSGDYQMAHDIARRIPDHPDVRAVIEPILALPDQPAQPDPEQPPVAPQPRPPEVPYPGTFTPIAMISIRWMYSTTCNIKSLRWHSLTQPGAGVPRFPGPGELVHSDCCDMV